MNCEQNKIINFLQNLKLNFDIKNNILEQWKSNNNSKQKKKPSSYILFSLDEREKLKKQDPSITKRNEVSKVISTKWKEIKEQQTEEYKKYVKLAEQPSSIEVNKPFKKFSASNRDKIKSKHSDKNAFEITTILKKQWFTLTEEERKSYNI